MTGTPHGWDIMSHMALGEMVSLFSLVLMPLAIIASLVIMGVAFAKKRNWIYITALVNQSAVLVHAAGGIVA